MTDSTNLWELVNKNPYNPHFWTELIVVSEETQNYDAIIKAYNGILSTFPLLHTYWFKLAQLQHNKLSARDASREFTEATRPTVLAHCIDMWYLYCDFVKRYSAEFSLGDIEQIFESAINYIGSDYNSDQIWSLYINTEQEHGEFKKVSQLFARVLSLPIRNLEQFWNSFSKHIEMHPVEDCVTPDEHLYIEQRVAEYAEQQELPSMEIINQARRQYIINLRQQKYSEALGKLQKVLYYELKIKQTYFHFQKPDKLEIANWIEYTEVAKTFASHEEVKHLYERALIPCAMCPEMWSRYAEYISKTDGIPEAVEILDRANATALCEDPSYHRMRGIFLEKSGMVEEAEKAYETLSKFKGAFAAIEYAFYLHRHDKDAAGYLIDFYNKATDPAEIAPVATLLFKLQQELNPEEILQRCKNNKLALATACDIFVKNNELQKAVDAFKAFVVGKAPLKDRLEANEYLVGLLQRHGAPIQDVRAAMKQQIMLEKEARLELRKQRREEAKNTADLSELLDRWIVYLQEADAAKSREQPAE